MHLINEVNSKLFLTLCLVSQSAKRINLIVIFGDIQWRLASFFACSPIFKFLTSISPRMWNCKFFKWILKAYQLCSFIDNERLLWKMLSSHTVTCANLCCVANHRLVTSGTDTPDEMRVRFWIEKTWSPDWLESAVRDFHMMRQPLRWSFIQSSGSQLFFHLHIPWQPFSINGTLNITKMFVINIVDVISNLYVVTVSK